jgi:hypothetical protein
LGTRKRLLAGWATAIVLMLAGAADASASSGAMAQGHPKLNAERHILQAHAGEPADWAVVGNG